MRVYACLWKLKDDFSCLDSGVIHFIFILIIFETGFLSSLGLASEPQGSSCAGITHLSLHDQPFL